MGSKYCGSCGEQVDEAKAFCPGCGNAFVEEEKRTTVTEFEGSEKTVQLGQTMYNQLLSDMGLNIAKPPGKTEPKTQVIRPEPVVKPVVVEPPKARPAYYRWLIIAAAVVVFGLVILIILAAIGIFFYLSPRFA
jgi:hypothetical protein